MKRHPWTYYSNLLNERILNPRNVGFFSDNTGSMQEMRVVVGIAGEKADNGIVRLSLVVDTTDGVIADAKFQAYGSSTLIGAADIICEIVLRKNYEQAKHITSEMIDLKLRDYKDIPAFPRDSLISLDLTLEAVKDAIEKCRDISLKHTEKQSPVPEELSHTDVYPNWNNLTSSEKLNLINEIIKEEIQPYIELDEGGIEVTEFINDQEIVIAYKGACTTCPSATGTTLDAIQNILRSRLSPKLEVKADLSLLNF